MSRGKAKKVFLSGIEYARLMIAVFGAFSGFAIFNRVVKEAMA